MSETKDWAADVGSLVAGLGKNLLGVAARVIHAAVGAEPFEILVLPATTRFAVISDIDDTVIQSRVSNFLQAARTVMLGNARTQGLGDIGWSSLSSARHFEHKTTVIRDIMQLYPHLEFILIGDARRSGLTRGKTTARSQLRTVESLLRVRRRKLSKTPATILPGLTIGNSPEEYRARPP